MRGLRLVDMNKHITQRQGMACDVDMKNKPKKGILKHRKGGKNGK